MNPSCLGQSFNVVSTFHSLIGDHDCVGFLLFTFCELISTKSLLCFIPFEWMFQSSTKDKLDEADKQQNKIYEHFYIYKII